MTKAYALVFGAVMATALMGCAKLNGFNLNNDQGGPAIDLTAKSADDVLNIKYNKALLKCNLWTQYTANLDLSAKPNDSLTIDLKDLSARSGVLALKAEIPNYQVEFDIKVASVETAMQFEYTDFNNANTIHYVMQNSPIAKIEYTMKAAVKFPTGVASNPTGKGAREVYEKIPTIVRNIAFNAQPEDKAKDENGELFHDYIQCTIDTDIKPAYQDQFKVNP